MTDLARCDAVHAYWFGALDADGMASREQQRLWFNPPPGMDETCRSDFGGDVAAALTGELDDWVDFPGGLIALILLLDQFTRNIHRGTREAFAGDARALSLARRAVAVELDMEMPAIHRVFLYMPFEHAEDLAAQDEGIAHFDRLMSEGPENARPRIADFRRYAVAHRDVIAQFGRFPHRNAILGRESTPEELAYLEKHGGF